MARSVASDPARLKELVLQIMDENRTLTIATLRSDGWPQATVVGFVHDDLTLYVAVAADSQKLDNLRRDPRVSVAIGHPERGGIRGLSIAARAAEVADWREIDRLNGLIRDRYPEAVVFAPRDSHAAVVRIDPWLISVIDETSGLRQPILMEVSAGAQLTPAGG
jgi:general stress protein 26